MANPALSNLSVPLKLDAFVFNQDVCDGGDHDAKIAPINQPNYTFLRINDRTLQNDLLDPVDLSDATPYKRNARLTDLGTGEIRSQRLGVYLHWMLPRLYRSGTAATPEAKSRSVRASSVDDPTAPSFREPPNRWMVIRKLDVSSIRPVGASIEPLDAWIVESDKLRQIDTLGPEVDLQVDVSPFVMSTASSESDPTAANLQQQAEVFVGYKESANTWTESHPKDDRVKIGLLNSSNELFADYQPHNGNVFSVLDKFSYTDADGGTATLTDAVASYYVLGWHEDPAADPMNSTTSTRTARLKELNATLNDSEKLSDWLNDKHSSRVVCHGAMYQVEWHDRWKPPGKPSQAPANVPANTFTKDLILKRPVAVGTTPMDSLLAYIGTNHESELENDIQQISSLLRAQSDSVTDQQAGDDEVQNYNFAVTDGGGAFVLPVQKDLPAQQPSAKDQEQLKLANEAQEMMNICQRATQKTQWDLFSLWWRYVTDVDNSLSGSVQNYIAEADRLYGTYKDLNNIYGQQKQKRDTAKNSLSTEPKASTRAGFAQAKDPCVVIAGAESGWPTDFADKLMCRLDYQIQVPKPVPQPSATDPAFLRCVPKELQATARALIAEFTLDEPAVTAPTTTASEDDEDFAKFPPLYHDQGDPKVTHPPDAPWRDRWNSTQPWFPLFVEWEAEFFHVEYDQWDLQSATSKIDSQEKFRHAIKDNSVPLWTKNEVVDDTRTVSGRILILPQPTFSLKVQIEQLFGSLPPDVLDGILPPAKRKELLAGVSSLALLSAPLAGFTNQLITTMQGNHLKPNIRVPGQEPVTMVEAYQQSSAVHLAEPQLRAIGIQSDLTPFGSLVPLANTGFSAFKPVTHGQFRFTKLTVVDKFGQCAPGIDQHPSPTGTPPLYPILSDYVAPQVLKAPDDLKDWANVAIKPEGRDLCEFAQIPPQINQASRVNTVFVVPDEDASQDDRPAYWRPVREWDSPIWGWVVVNYVDNGVQFFLKDGTFYREARSASPENPHPVSSSRRWQPLGNGDRSADTDQIDRLISLFVDSEDGHLRLENFIKMLTDAVARSKPAPGAYGQFVNALVGKPLALVNIGVSMELATEEKANQSTAKSQDGLNTKFHLLPQGSDDKSVYQFPLKLGDHNRLYDGLVGYFRAREEPWTTTDATATAAGNELDLSELYTSYGSLDKQTHYKPIDTSTFPKLRAFYNDPLSFVKETDPGRSVRLAANAKLNDNVFGCIIDPFLPLHAYLGGGVAPIQALTLPEWTWKTALDKMTAFFHFGPLLVTQDVAPYNKDYKLKGDYSNAWDKITVPNYQMPLPSLKLADWRWLQGYSQSEIPTGPPSPASGGNDDGADSDASSSGKDGDSADIEYMALALGKMDATPRFERGPYTAIEGYLQMKTAMEQSVPKKTQG